jgi:hypothetical protein
VWFWVEINAIYRLDAVEAIERGFNRDKRAMYAVERSVWRFVEPGGIVADGRALWGMLELSTPELMYDGYELMDEGGWTIWRFCVAQPDFPIK